MMIDLRPWRRLLSVWLPTVVLCVVTASFYIWQTSESGGRRARVLGAGRAHPRHAPARAGAAGMTGYSHMRIVHRP